MNQCSIVRDCLLDHLPTNLDELIGLCGHGGAIWTYMGYVDMDGLCGHGGAMWTYTDYVDME